MNNAKEKLESYKINKILKKDLENELKHNNTNEFIKNEYIKLDNELKLIETIITNLSQPYKSILYYKFIKEDSYQNIAIKLNYSIQRIYQLLNESFKKFEETYQNALKQK